ncbi:MAG TPA: Hsp20/alpha crystallin family protein [Sphingomicrobium sp.]|nr:Hsp20/alpha crystallin family protein [Sphingomicrobium sp.]
MTMHDITSVGRQQTPTPAFWHDYEAIPFSNFRRDIDRWFDSLFRKPAYGYSSYLPFSGAIASWPTLEVKDQESKVLVTAEVPGLSEKDVELFFDKGMLTLRGEKKSETDEPGYSELFYGRFERQIPLPYSVDMEHCTAAFHDGLLTIELPKVAEVENKKKIPIKVETRH